MKNVFVVGHNPFFNDSFWKPATVEEVLEYFKNKDSIAVDTETSGRDPHVKKLLTLQLGDSNAQFVIDLRHVDVKLFKPLLEEKLLLLHNSKFDYKFLKAADIHIEKIYDTMLAECVIYNGYVKFGYGLAALVKRYCNEEMSKETRGDFFKLSSNYLTDEQIRYAAKDVQHLHDIKAQQEENLKLYDLEYCAKLEFEAIKALADIEWNGMYLDKEEWGKIAETYTELCKNIEFELDDILLKDPSKKFKANGVLSLFDDVVRQLHFNYSSPTQVLLILRKLGFNVEDTNDRTLTKLIGQHPFIDKLQEYRGAITIVNRYGFGFLEYINKHTGRVHTDFWPVLATGRVSSGNDDMNAPNLQNIPADNKFRNCFKAREGFLWVSIDYSSQELRLMADGSKEEGFIDVLNRGEDLHCYAGSMMFKRPITKADKDLRNKAKTINFGKPYGMGPPKLADTLSIPIEEAEELFREYGKAFPKLNKWLDEQAAFAKKNAYSVTFAPCKRRRWYPDMKEARELRALGRDKLSKDDWRRILQIEGQTERNGMNMPIQGSGADICKEALVGVRNLIRDYNTKYNETVAYLICTVHDAIDVEVREDLADQFSEEMAKIMIEAGNKYVSTVEMGVDVTITPVWVK